MFNTKTDFFCTNQSLIIRVFNDNSFDLDKKKKTSIQFEMSNYLEVVSLHITMIYLISAVHVFMFPLHEESHDQHVWVDWSNSIRLVYCSQIIPTSVTSTCSYKSLFSAVLASYRHHWEGKTQCSLVIYKSLRVSQSYIIHKIVVLFGSLT